MIEVFKTNINSQKKARLLSDALLILDADFSISFDLEDCDKILRIKNHHINIEAVRHTAKELDIDIEVLPE